MPVCLQLNYFVPRWQPNLSMTAVTLSHKLFTYNQGISSMHHRQTLKTNSPKILNLYIKSWHLPCLLHLLAAASKFWTWRSPLDSHWERYFQSAPDAFIRTTNLGLHDASISSRFINHHSSKLAPKLDNFCIWYLRFHTHIIRAITSSALIIYFPNLLASHFCWDATGHIWKPLIAWAFMFKQKF